MIHVLGCELKGVRWDDKNGDSDVVNDVQVPENEVLFDQPEQVRYAVDLYTVLDLQVLLGQQL